MDFFSIMDSLYAFFHDNLFISAVLVLVLLYLLYRSPKLMLFLIVLIVLLTGIFYIISDVATTGSHQKGKMIKEHTTPE